MDFWSAGHLAEAAVAVKDGAGASVDIVAMKNGAVKGIVVAKKDVATKDGATVTTAATAVGNYQKLLNK